VAADSKARLLDDAERFILHGKISQAISAYLKIVTIDPDDILILNTIGDLYLKLNNVGEAGKYFSRVAENYVRNNFLLKALAVYKKILQNDPNNIEISLITASLFAKQGLSIDACNQYRRVAEILEQEGKAKEALKAYEKIVELSPSNLDVQLKLAALYQAEGAKEQAQPHWVSAARLQMQSGDFNGALNSFERAAQSALLDDDGLRGYLECCLKLGTPGAAIEQLKQSLEIAPRNLNIQEMLGQAYLESGDPEEAAKAFQAVVSLDESRCDGFFLVAQSFLKQEAYDQAIESLDPIIPILLSHRDTQRPAELYEAVLQRRPQYVPALTKLSDIYLAIGEQSRYLETMNEIVDCLLSENRYVEALEYLEKIIQADPGSEKHREMHRLVFAEAYPEAAYIPPAEPPQTPAVETSLMGEEDSLEAADRVNAFCSDDLHSMSRGDAASPPLHEAMAEVSDVLCGTPSKSVEEQLQEVDFYIRLGFNGEALEKLDEIAKTQPDHPELASRYETLREAKAAGPESAAVEDLVEPVLDQSYDESALESLEDFQFPELDAIGKDSQGDRIEKLADGDALEILWDDTPSATESDSQLAEFSQKVEPAKPGERQAPVNDMFVDLMDEVRTIDTEEAKANFEEHFSLGTAYREMDLIEEAIKEFETALKSVNIQKGDPKVILCCGMLSTCFLKKNMPHSALRWCQTGLDLPDISSHEAMALRYDMGVAHSMAGSKAQALNCFDEIFSADPGYRDVAQRIDELRGGFEQHDS
jgi:tetratricopeptide (TPR) repeat protein